MNVCGAGRRIKRMTDEDAILSSTAVYSEEEVLAEFWESCEAEAEAPGHYTKRLKFAAEDLCQMLDRKNGAGRSKKK